MLFSMGQRACSLPPVSVLAKTDFLNKNYVTVFLVVPQCYSTLHQARERQRREEQDRLVREAVDAETKRMDEEEARKRAAREAAEKEAALAKIRQEKALSLGAEPEKGPNVTQVNTSSLN
jgi:predicted metal-dependent peptidase